MIVDGSINDSELLTSLVQGNRNAFDQIYRRYVTELYNYARRNIVSPEDCEEIVQDVFVSLWSRHSTLQIENLRFYLIGAVRNKIIRYCQHATVRDKYAEHFQLFESIYDPFNEQDTSDIVDNTFINKSLRQLPERCQVAFRLRLRENLSYEEIASRMNINTRTVKNYMATAIVHLRDRWENNFKPGQILPTIGIWLLFAVTIW